MSRDEPTLLETIFEAERRVYRSLPVDERYSKLVFRSVLWFLFFTLVFALVRPLL